MRSLIVRRLLVSPLVLLVASLLIFLLAEVVAGDPARTALGPFATDEQLGLWREQHGLDGAWPSRYGRWLSGIVRGDWGESALLAVPVRPLVLSRLGNSILLGVYALAIVVPVAVAAGLWAGTRPGRASDRAITVGGLALASTPEFVTGTALLVVFAIRLDWFPANADLPPGIGFWGRLRAMTLPAATVALAVAGYLARMVRAGTIAAVDTTYHRTAVLKGLTRRRVVSRHVLRNALLPTVAVLGTQFASMVGGIVVVESVFNYRGIGELLVAAARGNDIVVLEAAALTVTTMSILVLLATDVGYRLLDPRIRHPRAA